jgi:hypothetical protein
MLIRKPYVVQIVALITIWTFFYQNVRGLRTKSSGIYDNVCSADFKITCLTETWLSESFINHNLFPESYTVYRADRVYDAIQSGGGALTEISDTVMGVKRQSELEFCEECVWIELPMSDGFRLLNGNHYFSPGTKVDI